MKDVQNQSDSRGVDIQKVGIKGLELPLTVQRKDAEDITIYSSATVGVSLPSHYKGTHMSRFVEVLNEWRNKKMLGMDIKGCLETVVQKLNAKSGYLKFDFKYFMDKESPITRIVAPMCYDCFFEGNLENFGEEEQYYVRDHHEPIVSREVWEQAKEIHLSRNRQSNKMADGKREKYTKKYAFSSMCECVFCGTKLTRRTLHSSSKYETPVWYCRNAANKGKHNCPNSKSVHESILENAFLEAYKLLAGNFDDVIDSVIDTIESVSTNNEDIGRLKKEQKALDNLEQRRKKLTDLYLDDGISKEAYDEKYEELSVKIQKSKESIAILKENVSNQKDVSKRMATLKKALAEGDMRWLICCGELIMKLMREKKQSFHRNRQK